MTEFWAALISSLIAFLGVVLTVVVTSKNTRNDVTRKLEISQAVTDTKIERLAEEVRLHNNFARRMPVVEEQIKVINHRIEGIENMKE